MSIRTRDPYRTPDEILTAAELDELEAAVTDPANFTDSAGGYRPNPLVKMVGRLAVEVKDLRAEVLRLKAAGARPKPKR